MSKRIQSLRRLKVHRRVGLVVAAAVAVLGTMILGMLLYYGSVLTKTIENTEVLADSLATQADVAFASVPLTTAAEKRKMRTYLNKEHVARAKTLGIESLPTRDAAVEFTQQDKLTPLSATDYYFVEEMTHSVPYVTESTANLLEEIGIRFQAALREEGLPPYRYVITSATRSEEDQKRLRRGNVNAATESSHQFGTTVDIHYRKFLYAASRDTLTPPPDTSPSLLEEKLFTAYANLGQAHHARLEAILGRVLLELQAEGKVLVIYERRQPVYHITVAKKVKAPQPDSLFSLNTPVVQPAPSG